jgi:hypothetical protein
MEIIQNRPADGTQTEYSYHSFSRCHIEEDKTMNPVTFFPFFPKTT